METTTELLNIDHHLHWTHYSYLLEQQRAGKTIDYKTEARKVSELLKDAPGLENLYKGFHELSEQENVDDAAYNTLMIQAFQVIHEIAQPHSKKPDRY